ncbi:unnamed protein product [Caenorhabditis nigoni]
MKEHEKQFVDFFGFRTYEERINQFLDDASKLRKEENKIYTAHYLFPLVEEIGCNEWEVYNKNMYCLLSPDIPEKYTKDGFFEPKYLYLDAGEAGSNCDYGYENNDGLCKYTGVTTSTVSITTKKSIENDVPNEQSSSNFVFSMVHILVVLGFGYSIFT